MAQSICDVVNKKLKGSKGRCSLVVHKESVKRLASLQEDVTNFALISSRLQYNLLKNPRFTHKYPSLKRNELRSVMSLQVFPYIFLSAQKSFKSAEELLRNKNFLFPKNFPVKDNDYFVQVCTDCVPKCSKDCKCVDCADVKDKDIKSLKNHSGFGLILPRHQSILNKVLASSIARPLGFSKDFMEKYFMNRVIKNYPFLSEISVLLPAVGSEQKSITTFGPSLTLVTTTQTSKDLVFLVTKEIIENIKVIKKKKPGIGYLPPQKMSRAGLTAPIHKGAEMFFKERNLR